MSGKPKRRKPSLAKEFAKIEALVFADSPAGMAPFALHLYAEWHLSAATSLPAHDSSFEPVRPYLVCHAIELALKAFLSVEGVKMLDLAGGAYGHDLESLLDASLDRGLSRVVALADDQLQSVRGANRYYQGKLFEYPALGEAITAYPDMPCLNALTEVAFHLVEDLRDPCRKAK